MMGGLTSWRKWLSALGLVWILALQSFLVNASNRNAKDSTALDESDFYHRAPSMASTSRHAVRRTPSYKPPKERSSSEDISHNISHESSDDESIESDDNLSDCSQDQNCSKNASDQGNDSALENDSRKNASDVNHISAEGQNSDSGENASKEEDSHQCHISKDNHKSSAEGDSHQISEVKKNGQSSPEEENKSCENDQKSSKNAEDETTSTDVKDENYPIGDDDNSASNTNSEDSVDQLAEAAKEAERGLKRQRNFQYFQDYIRKRKEKPQSRLDTHDRLTDVEATILPFASDDSTLLLRCKNGGYTFDQPENILRPEEIVREYVFNTAVQEERVKENKIIISTPKPVDESKPPVDESKSPVDDEEESCPPVDDDDDSGPPIVEPSVVVEKNLVPVERIYRLLPTGPITSEQVPLLCVEPIHKVPTSESPVIPVLYTPPTNEPNSNPTVTITTPENTNPNLPTTANTNNTANTNANAFNTSNVNNNTGNTKILPPSERTNKAFNQKVLGDITNPTNLIKSQQKLNQTDTSGNVPQRIRLLGKPIYSRLEIADKTSPTKNYSPPIPKNKSAENPPTISNLSLVHQPNNGSRQSDINILFSSEPSAQKELGRMSYLSIFLFTSLCLLLTAAMAVLGFNMRKTYRASTAHPPPANFVDTRLEQTTVEPVPSFA